MAQKAAESGTPRAYARPVFALGEVIDTLLVLGPVRTLPPATPRCGFFQSTIRRTMYSAASLAVGYIAIKLTVVVAWFVTIKLSVVMAINLTLEGYMELHANLRLVMHAALRGPGGELNHASDEAA